MRKTPRKPLLLFLAALLAASAQADDYDDARAEMVAAYEAQDYPAMRAAADRSLAARPDYPGALFNRALAETLDADAVAAFHTLRQLMKQGIDYRIEDIDAFASLKDQPGWQAYIDSVERWREPVGDARIVHRYDDSEFVPEGIAIDENGRLFLGSIRHGDIVRIDGSAEVLATAKSAGHWSVFGMRHDGKGTLWYVSSAIEQFAGLDDAHKGRTGLFAVDVDTGSVKTAAMSDSSQVLGDLLILDDDSILVVDQGRGGGIQRYTISTGAFSSFVDPGHFVSPQGIVANASNNSLYVADYVGGLFRVELATGEIEKLDGPADTSLYGIDGLYRHGNSLVAIQNGIQPNRVVKLELSADGRAVTRGQVLAWNLEAFDEPNLGQVVGDEFFFIANSHWNRFDRDGNLPDGLEGPIVLAIELD